MKANKFLFPLVFNNRAEYLKAVVSLSAYHGYFEHDMETNMIYFASTENRNEKKKVFDILGYVSYIPANETTT